MANRGLVPSASYSILSFPYPRRVKTIEDVNTVESGPLQSNPGRALSTYPLMLDFNSRNPDISGSGIYELGMAFVLRDLIITVCMSLSILLRKRSLPL